MAQVCLAINPSGIGPRSRLRLRLVQGAAFRPVNTEMAPATAAATRSSEVAAADPRASSGLRLEAVGMVTWEAEPLELE